MGMPTILQLLALDQREIYFESIRITIINGRMFGGKYIIQSVKYKRRVTKSVEFKKSNIGARVKFRRLKKSISMHNLINVSNLTKEINFRNIEFLIFHELRAQPINRNYFPFLRCGKMRRIERTVLLICLFFFQAASFSHSGKQIVSNVSVKLLKAVGGALNRRMPPRKSVGEIITVDEMAEGAKNFIRLVGEL